MSETRSRSTRVWLAIGFPFVGVLFATGILPAQTKSDKEQKLEGRWEVVSSERSGAKDSEEKIKGYVMTLEKGKFSVSRAGKDLRAGTYKVDSSTRPRRIDLVFTAGRKGNSLGIYKISGDRLTICFSKPSPSPVPEANRPKEFSSTKGNEFRLNVYRQHVRNAKILADSERFFPWTTT